MENDLERLADGFSTMIMKGLGSRSQFALRTSIDADHSEGITGACVLWIPSRFADRLDVTFTIGDVELLSRWEAGARK